MVHRLFRNSLRRPPGRLCCVLIVPLLGLACAQHRPSASAPPSYGRLSTARSYASPSDDIPGLPNFAKVSDGLYRGAQPTREGFVALKQMGVKTVIDLR